MARKERLPKNVSSFLDRHGKRRYRFRMTGRETVYFDHAPSEAEVAPLRAKSGPVERHQHGTIGWLAHRFYLSPAFVSGKGATRLVGARRILDKFLADYSKDRVADVRFDHIEAILMKTAQPGVSDKGRKTGGPHAARNLRSELLPLFNHAVKLGLIPVNPVVLADAPAVPRGGFHTWTEDEIAQYRARWSLATKPRLALEIALWTVGRKGDVSTFGPRHISNGKIVFTAAKTGKQAVLPLAPQLRAAIDAMVVIGTEAFLITDYGKPFSKAGLGNRMREWCDAAGLPGCTMHGLRKASARRAAELGAEQQGLKAMGQWSSDAQVAVYVADAKQERMADAAFRPVIEMDLANRQS